MTYINIEDFGGMPEKEHSFRNLFSLNWKKHSDKSFFKRLISTMADTESINVIVVINGKAYWKRDIFVKNPEVSCDKINEILGFDKEHNLHNVFWHGEVTNEHGIVQEKKVKELRLK